MAFWGDVGFKVWPWGHFHCTCAALYTSCHSIQSLTLHKLIAHSTTPEFNSIWESLSGKRGVCVFVSTESTQHKEADMKCTRKIMSSVGSLTELSDTDISMPSVCSEIKKCDIFLYIRHMLWLCHLRGRKKQSSQDQWFEPSDVTHSKWPIYHGCPSVNNECLILVTFNNTQLDSNTYVWNDGKWWWNDGNIISLTQLQNQVLLYSSKVWDR